MVFDSMRQSLGTALEAGQLRNLTISKRESEALKMAARTPPNRKALTQPVGCGWKIFGIVLLSVSSASPAWDASF